MAATEKIGSHERRASGWQRTISVNMPHVDGVAAGSNGCCRQNEYVNVGTTSVPVGPITS